MHARIVRAVPVAFALLLLGACQARDTIADAASASGPAPGLPAKATLHGRALYLQRILMPAGTSLRVQLVDDRLADTQAAILAETVLHDVPGPPYAFALDYDPGKLRADGSYGLHLSLYDAEGRLRFVTDTRVPFVPGQAEVGDITMTMVGARQPAPAADATAGTGTAADVPSAEWRCGDLPVSSRFPQGRVALRFSGRSLSLPQAVSADGGRYADAAGNEFWTRGNEAMFTLAGTARRDCVRTHAP